MPCAMDYPIVMTQSPLNNHSMSAENAKHFSKADYAMMSEAIHLAKRGRYTTAPNPCVGCVIVKDDVIVAQGWHQIAGDNHAEINALNQANPLQLIDSTVYVTLEPCSHTGRTGPCAQALIEARVGRVVIAMMDSNPKVSGRGIEMLEAQGIKVDVGLLSSQAKTLNQEFFHCMKTGRPFVRLKMAASFDGATAMANGESQWITGQDARRDVHKYRALSCAILSTAKTVLADNAKLNARIDETMRLSDSHLSYLFDNDDNNPDKPIRQPVRIVLDKHLSLLEPDNIKRLDLFKQSGEVWLVCLASSHSREQATVDFIKERFQLSADIKLIIAKESEATVGMIDLPALLNDLGARQINNLWVEAGATLAGQFLKYNLINQCVLYMAPMFCGDLTRPIFEGAEFKSLSNAKRFKLLDERVFGVDRRFIFEATS